LIQNILIFDDVIWVTTKSGLFSLNIVTEKIEVFTTKYGRISNNFTVGEIHVTPDSTLFLGNGNGISYFNINNPTSFKTHTRFRFRDLYINNKLVNEDNKVLDKHISLLKKIKLDYDQNNLTLHVSPMDFYLHYKDRFAYKLEGFNENWIYKYYNQPIIEYTNLPSGKYTLVIASIDENNHQIGQLRKLQIFIATPFWKTKWFYGLVVAFLILVVYLVLKLRVRSIAQQNKILEQKVDERTELINEQKVELSDSHKQLEISIQQLQDQNSLIESNIRYASLIQNSILPELEELNDSYEDSFIYYKPKDVVSGDFYWHSKINNHTITVVGDCTGHGVSGAFMSMLGLTTLNFIVNDLKKTCPNEILDWLNTEVHRSLQKNTDYLKDGMDVTVLSYDNSNKKLRIAGAMSDALVIHGEEVIKFRGDRFPIGADFSFYPKINNFTLLTKELTTDTTVYLFTDGFQDQFHHSTGKKYMKRTFREWLLNNKDKPLETQKDLLDKEFTLWKGETSQVDDVLIMGLKISI